MSAREKAEGGDALIEQQTPSTGIPSTESWCSGTAETQRSDSCLLTGNVESSMDPSRCLLDEFDMVGGTEDRQSAMLRHWMKRVQAYQDSLSEAGGGREEVKCYAGRILREYTGLQEKILAHYIMQQRGSTQQRVKRPKRGRRKPPRQRFSFASCLRSHTA